MSIPDYQALMLPMLKMANTGLLANQEALIRVSEDFNLSDKEINQLLPSGIETIIKNRTGWAITYLCKAGLLYRPRRAHFTITEKGKELLAEKPKKVDKSVLEKYPDFIDFRDKKRKNEVILSEDVDREDGTPEERILKAMDEILDEVKADLISKILELSPEFFERLVIKLLLAMGYGGETEEAGIHSGKSGDGGIDGIIYEDKLGLENIYIQAKRYAPDNTVGRPDIQKFSGSLSEVKATKGVFFTTSSFSKEAKNSIGKLQQKIVLIDGDKLATLMIEHNVGVRNHQDVKIKRIDEDFFNQ